MLCRALMLVVELTAAKLMTLVEQKTIRVMRMKTELTIWLIRNTYTMPHFMISIWNSHFIELVGKNDHCYFLLIHFQCTSYTGSYSANTYCKRGMQQTLLFQTSPTYRSVKLTFSRLSLKAVVRSPCQAVTMTLTTNVRMSHVYLYQWMLVEFIPYCD